MEWAYYLKIKVLSPRILLNFTCPDSWTNVHDSNLQVFRELDWEGLQIKQQKARLI